MNGWLLGYALWVVFIIIIAAVAYSKVRSWIIKKILRSTGRDQCTGCGLFFKKAELEEDGLCENCRMHHAAALAHQRHPAMQRRHP